MAYACHYGYFEIFKDLLVAVEEKHGKEKLSTFLNKVSKSKENFLHLSIKSGNADVVKMVIEYGKEMIDLKDAEGRTPIHAAVSSGNLEILKEIAALDGCDWLCEDKRGRTPLWCAVEKKSVQVLEFVLSATQKHASEEAYRKVLNKTNKNGYSPLLLAAKSKSMDSFKVCFGFL